MSWIENQNVRPNVYFPDFKPEKVGNLKIGKSKTWMELIRNSGEIPKIGKFQNVDVNQVKTMRNSEKFKMQMKIR